MRWHGTAPSARRGAYDADVRSLLIATVVSEFEVAGNGIFLGPIVESATFASLPTELEVIAVAYGWCSPADLPTISVRVRGADGLDVSIEHFPDRDDPIQLQPIPGSDLQNFLGTWPLVLTFERAGLFFVEIEMAGEEGRSHPIAIVQDPSLS